jgi:hypothetical protein
MPPKKFVLPRSNDVLDALPPMKKSRRPTKKRPEGMSKANLAADIQRQTIVNHDRRQREAAAKMKKPVAVVARGPPHCPDVFGS